MSPRFLAMRERVLAAIMSNPVVGPDSPGMLERVNDPEQDCTFEELGFDSLARMEFCIFLETEYGITVTSGEVEGCPSINAMATYLAGMNAGR
jgi:acyl carrier protein